HERPHPKFQPPESAKRAPPKPAILAAPPEVSEIGLRTLPLLDPDMPAIPAPPEPRQNEIRQNEPVQVFPPPEPMQVRQAPPPVPPQSNMRAQAPAQPQPEPAAPLIVAASVQEARRVGGDKPAYPPLARQMRISGVVKLQ